MLKQVATSQEHCKQLEGENAVLQGSALKDALKIGQLAQNNSYCCEEIEKLTEQNHCLEQRHTTAQAAIVVVFDTQVHGAMVDHAGCRPEISLLQQQLQAAQAVSVVHAHCPLMLPSGSGDENPYDNDDNDDLDSRQDDRDDGQWVIDPLLLLAHLLTPL